MNWLGYLSTVATWIVIFVVVKIIARKAGVDDEKMSVLIKKIHKFQAKMHKHNAIMKKKKTEKDGSVNFQKLVRYLKKDVINYRKADKIFNVYLFDNSDDKNVSNIRKEFANCEVMLKDLIVEFLHNYADEDKEKDLDDKENQIDFICDKVCQKLEKERQKQLDDKMHKI